MTFPDDFSLVPSIKVLSSEVLDPTNAPATIDWQIDSRDITRTGIA